MLDKETRRGRKKRRSVALAFTSWLLVGAALAKIMAPKLRHRFDSHTEQIFI